MCIDQTEGLHQYAHLAPPSQQVTAEDFSGGILSVYINILPTPMDVEGPGKETEPEAVSTPQRAELSWYDANLVFKDGESIDMDLLNENRSLIHTGKLSQKFNTRFGWNGWIELFVLLFDNYLVMTKPEQKDGAVKYQVYRRPIPLEFLTLSAFTDPPTQGGGSSQWPLYKKNQTVYPFTINHIGRSGGLYTLSAESFQARLEWKSKLEEAIGMRKVVQESNKLFEMETLSVDTFSIPAPLANAGGSMDDDGNFTGKVTCSIPFSAPDGRKLMAVGCAQGVWIGSRHDPRSLVRVLHLQMVTQCAVLEDYGIFIVLADNSLFAYHIDALVPSSPGTANPACTPQKLSGNKNVQFFTTGTLDGRTLVIYMKKENLNSVFRVLEPVIGKICYQESPQAQAPIKPKFGLRKNRSEWFRVYRDFFLPHVSHDLLFLRARVVILCGYGFEIMDLSDFKSVTIPQRDDPQLKNIVKRIKSCKPIGMFKCQRDEFLLCYDEFGLYVNKHGDPLPKGIVEWEGTAERAALHAKHILLFDRRFIEIRHVETGHLVQVIHGADMRCTWDDRGTNQSQTPPDSRESRVHGVMNVETPPSGRGRVITQQVFELVPMVPLPLGGL